MTNKWLCTAVAVLGSVVGLIGAAWADEGAGRCLRFYGRVLSETKTLKGGVSDFDITVFLKPGKNELVLVTCGWKVTYPLSELDAIKP